MPARAALAWGQPLPLEAWGVVLICYVSYSF
jgi:hypothetical protein